MAGLLQYFWAEARQHKETIVIFSRYPVPGKAKTRLIPLLGDAGAALAQRFMTEHILDVVHRFQCQHQSVRVEIQYYGGTDSEMRYWMDRRVEKKLSWKPQRGDTLGDKIKNAFEDHFAQGEERVLVVGSDIPGISVEILEEALDMLRSEASQMVLGKALDGGYYLVGLQRKTQGQLDELFAGMDWGTDKVFRQQCQAADRAGITTNVLTAQLQDVDLPEDIKEFEKVIGVSSDSLRTPKLSVVIPTLNEARTIGSCIQRLLEQCSDTNMLGEIIIADGGSKDDTLTLIEQLQDGTNVPIIAINCDKGRGVQLNAGAKAATGDIVLFLHADTKLPDDFHVSILSCLNTPGNVAGAFPFDVYFSDGFEPSFLFGIQMDIVKWGARQRNIKMELPYGDQGIFLRRQILEKIGGVPETLLFEDFILVEKLKQIGHVAITDSEPARTSARRWEENGVIKTTGSNYLFVVGYRLGIHPDTLAAWYYGKFKPVTQPHQT
ncbi:uncharacterized protein LOC106159171 isoform X2 [Lingula anatina]|uniref:Uncharacterized protein LOC106159171 isoform X2 n=1 Tax=Lingula anatina TaxID=7574 RepID=A0A1S3I0F9_LINAN|nr:uncharacterized protein LOC106159171 isoform X2 [Lingula anatina]|eukprot:XP_013390834.1 uncharacterized protein LOC106159171 isoform X2 [Lingula anatina]